MDRWLRSIGCVAALLGSACGARGTNNDFGSEPPCANGERQECVCEGTMTPGVRLCGADMRFTACVCEGVDGGVVVDDLGASFPDVPLTGLDRPASIDVPATDRGPAGPGALGATCTQLNQCASGICLPSGRCSRTCAGAADCPTSIGWSCTALPGLGPVCGCTPRGAETCNGLDDDCDGVADNGITRCGGACVDLQSDAANCGGCGIACGGGTSCVRGSCVCPASLPTACGGRCVATATDPANCGGCGVACAGSQRCEGGRCTTTTVGMCPSGCSASADCNSCRTPSDPAGSAYCCLSGLCIYSSSACGTSTDAGLPDAPPVDLPASGGSDSSLSD